MFSLCVPSSGYPKTNEFNKQYGTHYIDCYPQLQKILNDRRVTYASVPPFALHLLSDEEQLNFPFDKSYFKTVAMSYSYLNKVL